MLLPRSLMGSFQSSLTVLVLVFWHIQQAASVYDPVTKIETARLYGNVDSFAYYYVDLLVGSPRSQRVSVIVDTGSTIAGFPCANCHHCGDHLDPPFDIGESKTAKWMACSSSCSAGCQEGKCSYSQTYSEGSSITGDWFQDYMKLGDAAQSNPAVLAQLGCHNSENKLFYSQRANGILGLAPSQGEKPTILTDLFHDTKHVNSDMFALCLSAWGGKLHVGGYNASSHTGLLSWVPLSLDRYYVVTLTGMQIEGLSIADGKENFGTAMLDSGTTYTYFPNKMFNKIEAAVKAYCDSHAGCDATPAGNCWLLNKSDAGPVAFPPMNFQFNDVMVTWYPQAYLYQRGSTNQWCPAYADNGASFSTVMGATWMLNKEVIFDMTKKRVGIAEAACPSYRRSPQLQPVQTMGKSLDTPPVDLAKPMPNVGAVTLSQASFLLCILFVALLVVPATRAWRSWRGGAQDACPEQREPIDLYAEE